LVHMGVQEKMSWRGTMGFTKKSGACLRKKKREKRLAKEGDGMG